MFCFFPERDASSREPVAFDGGKKTVVVGIFRSLPPTRFRRDGSQWEELDGGDWCLGQGVNPYGGSPSAMWEIVGAFVECWPVRRSHRFAGVALTCFDMLVV